MATSSSHYFRETLRGAERRGFNPDDFLKRVGLDAANVYDPAWRGSSEKLAELVQLVWLILDDEFWSADAGINGAYGKGGSTTSSTGHANTHVNGTGDVSTVTNDLALKGATVTGNSVTADVKNLTIESQVDTARAKADQLNVSGQIGFGNTGVSGSGQKVKGDAAIVSEHMFPAIYRKRS